MTHLIAAALATVAIAIPGTAERSVGESVADAGAAITYTATGATIESVGAISKRSGGGAW